MNHIGDTTHIAADNIFAGKYEEESEPKIYADRRASGVKKNKFRSDIYAEKIDDVTSSEEFRATRRDVNRLVKKMLNKLALDGAGEEE
jgi:hypothetical protein